MKTRFIFSFLFFRIRFTLFKSIIPPLYGRTIVRTYRQYFEGIFVYLRNGQSGSERKTAEKPEEIR